MAWPRRLRTSGASGDFDPGVYALYTLGSHRYSFVYGPGDARRWTIDWSAGTAVSKWVETWTLGSKGP